MSLIPWAAKKESECSCSVTQVSMESRQSKAVAVLDLKHLQGKLAGDLEAGFLALKFTGEQLEGLLTHVASRSWMMCSLTQHPV